MGKETQNEKRRTKNGWLKLFVFGFSFSLFSVRTVRADDQNDDLMKAASMDAGKVSGSDKQLYEESIRSTKSSLARETLDVVYKDAMDAYRDERYDEALGLFDQIYAVDPNYEDVQSMRVTIQRLKANQNMANAREVVDQNMHKANEAVRAGQNVLAISYWKKALEANPNYAPAQKKIDEMNHALAQKQFEVGYLHYHHGDFEDALDAWANAIALDPTYKQRGLLLLMSKVELSINQAQVSRLASQAYDQFQQNDLTGALHSYEEVLKLEPRHEEARRMAAKIKIQLGEAAFKAASQSASQRKYADAIKSWQDSISYNYEVQRSSAAIIAAEAKLKRQHEPVRVVRKPKPAPAAPVVDQSTPTVAAVPEEPRNPEEALEHYRQGLGAIRTKDFHRALDELEIAYKLDPSDERIYMARERARQEWDAANSGRGTPTP